MKKLCKLPVLDQASFPVVSDLPYLNEGEVMDPIHGSRLKQFEAELVLAIVTTHAKRKNEWQPVSKEDFNKLLRVCDLPEFMCVQVDEAIGQLCDQELLDYVVVGNKPYIVPTPKFACMLDVQFN